MWLRHTKSRPLGPYQPNTDMNLKLYRSDSSNNINHYYTYFHITLLRNQSTQLGMELHITLHPIAVIYVQLKGSTQQWSATSPGTDLYFTPNRGWFTNFLMLTAIKTGYPAVPWRLIYYLTVVHEIFAWVLFSRILFSCNPIFFIFAHD